MSKKKPTKKTNKSQDEREELLDQIERLYVMGVRKVWQIKKITGVTDYRTIQGYLRTIKQRLDRRYADINRDEYFKRQVEQLDQGIKEAWLSLAGAVSNNEKAKVLRIMGVLLKQQAELLGLEAPKKLTIGGGYGERLVDLLAKMDNDKAQKIVDELKAVSGGHNNGGGGGGDL